MSDFSLVALGVGDAFSRRYYSTSLALCADGQWFLLDCPHPIRKIMAESGAQAGIALDVPQIQGVLLTHLHADHVSGLEGLAFYSRFVVGRPLPVYTHPAVARDLWEGCLRASMGQLMAGDTQSFREMTLQDYIALQLADAENRLTAGPFELELRRTLHHIPTFAMRIRHGDRTLGWSSDTAFDPTLIDWLSPADLIIHETNLGAHTPYEKLAGLPAELRQKMRLIHYPDDFSLETSVITPLLQGQRISV